MKFRVGLFIKNLGLLPIYGIGGLFCVGLLAGGAYAIDKKDFVKEQISKVADITKNAENDLINVNENIDIAFNSSDEAQVQIQTTIDNFTSLKEKLDEIANSSTTSSSGQQTDENTKSEISQISKDVETMINTLKGIEIPKRDSFSNIESIIGPNGSATTLLSQINTWLTDNNKDDSPLWVYYDLVSKILLSIGTVLIGLFSIGFILLIVFNKRVDGYWVSRKNIKKHLALHIKKLMKKCPELSKHLMQKYGV